MCTENAFYFKRPVFLLFPLPLITFLLLLYFLVLRGLISPLISSGIDPMAPTQGTGYTIFLRYERTNTYALRGIYRTPTHQYKFGFNEISVNKVYKIAFTWQKYQNKIFAIRDDTITDTVEAEPITDGPYEQLPWATVINIGAFNYKSVTTTHKLIVYELKLWRRYLTQQSIRKLMSDKPGECV